MASTHTPRIWLEDLASTLSTIRSKAPRTYAGFDISASHFPHDEEKGAVSTYAVHDILAPFPEAYHGKFDGVHVRLLVLALKKEQIKVAAENAARLLSESSHVFCSFSVAIICKSYRSATFLDG